MHPPAEYNLHSGTLRPATWGPSNQCSYPEISRRAPIPPSLLTMLSTRPAHSPVWRAAFIFIAACSIPVSLFYAWPRRETPFPRVLWRRKIDGVGFRTPCRQEIDDMMASMSEFDKAASAAAATILTLLPALLTFAPIPTANLRELMYISWSLAFWTGGMTFGLPVSQKSTISRAKIIKGKDFIDSTSQFNMSDVENPATDLQQPVEASATQRCFGTILTSRKNPTTMVLLISLLQSQLFTILCFDLRRLEPMDMMWICRAETERVKFGWLLGFFLVSSLVTVFWRSPPDMVFQLSRRGPGEVEVETNQPSDRASESAPGGCLRELCRLIHRVLDDQLWDRYVGHFQLIV